MSQWFFGASFLERVHVASGGECLVNSVNVNHELCRTRQRLTAQTHPAVYERLDPAFSEMHPTAYAGWHGGIDVSGHTFVLTLSILYLTELIVPYVPNGVASSLIPSALRSQRPVLQVGPWWSQLANRLVLCGILGLVILWTIMLCMTSMYFHTVLEKVVGFMCALAVWVWMPKEEVSAYVA